ncbi:alpha-L-fucosidase [Labilibacter marinus]|uniref:alpha-L-fucosidase n=1 Tax=Labilibacter marinus TaxID=1477105 RepID=UPI00082CC549|nr:alpha-L-fucosidase [Labilibacter marinus]
MKSLLLGCIILWVMLPVIAQKYTPTSYPEEFQTTEESLNTHKKVPESVKDAKLGINFHWGAYTVPAYGIRVGCTLIEKTVGARDGKSTMKKRMIESLTTTN